MGGVQLKIEVLVTCKMCLFSLYFVKYMALIVWKALEITWITFVGNFFFFFFWGGGGGGVVVRGVGRAKKQGR